MEMDEGQKVGVWQGRGWGWLGESERGREGRRGREEGKGERERGGRARRTRGRGRETHLIQRVGMGLGQWERGVEREEYEGGGEGGRQREEEGQI